MVLLKFLIKHLLNLYLKIQYYQLIINLGLLLKEDLFKFDIKFLI